MSSYPAARSSRIDAVSVVVVLLGAALVTWIVTVQRMRGMDAGPGSDLGGLGWYLGVWVTMMAAMMLPSAAPMVLLFHRVAREREKRRQPFVPTWVFLLAYLAVWTLYGLAAYAAYRLLVHVDVGFLAWDRGGPYIAGAAIIFAGVYELTPLKSACLRQCRGPMHFVLGHWRPGWLGALRMGGEHGAFCVGCCWGLMIVLFALGVMSLTWMALVAALIFAQKVLPKGERLTWIFALLFVVAGAWVAAAPGTVPGLTLPNSQPASGVRMRMMHMTPTGRMAPKTPAASTRHGGKIGDGSTGSPRRSSPTPRLAPVRASLSSPDGTRHPGGTGQDDHVLELALRDRSETVESATEARAGRKSGGAWPGLSAEHVRAASRDRAGGRGGVPA